MRRHLASARTGVVSRSNALQEHIVRLDPERQTQCTIPIIGIEPVITGFHRQAGGRTNALMSGSRHLKINLLLALQQNLAVVNPPGGIDDAVGLDQLLMGKSFIRLTLPRAIGHEGQLGVGLCRGHPVPGS